MMDDQHSGSVMYAYLPSFRFVHGGGPQFIDRVPPNV